MDDTKKIYHYCSIDTLEKIINYKTLRFGRFDLMDDQTETAGLPEILKKRYYLSCWVADEKEKIPQWAMYAPKGVRIEFPLIWYLNHAYTDFNTREFIKSLPQLEENHPASDIFFPFPSLMFWGGQKSYSLIPPLNKSDGFFVKVRYDDDFKKLKKKHWSPSEDGKFISLTHTSEPIKYKDSYWSFQDEIRFFLMVSCHPNEISNLPPHFDIPVDPAVFGKFKVRLHPNCSAQDSRKIIDILSQNFPGRDTGDVIERSDLDGKYFPKPVMGNDSE